MRVRFLSILVSVVLFSIIGCGSGDSDDEIASGSNIRQLEVSRGNFDDVTLDDSESIDSDDDIFPWIKRFNREPCGFTNPPDGNVQAHSGNNVAYIEISSSYDQDFIFLSQQIKDEAFVSGKTYILSAWIARVSDQECEARIMIGTSANPADTNPLDNPLSETIVYLSQKNQWYFASVAYMAQPGDYGIPIYIAVNGKKPSANAARIYFDDIILTEE